MKKWGLVGLAVVLVLAIAACGKRTDGANGAGDKVYKFATDAQYSPMEMMNKDKVVGFDADFLDAVMKEAGLQYKLDNTGWQTMLNSVQSGTEYDGGISSVSITDDRKPSYDYSIPYFESTNMIMTKKDSGVKNALDLKGKMVGVQTTTTAETLMKKIMGNDNSSLKSFESNALAFLELDKGGLDAVVADIAIVREYLKQNPNKNYEATLDPEHFTSEFYGILLPKGSKLKEKLDPAIKKVLESGKYAEIYKKWMGEEPNVQNVLNAKA